MAEEGAAHLRFEFGTVEGRTRALCLELSHGYGAPWEDVAVVRVRTLAQRGYAARERVCSGTARGWSSLVCSSPAAGWTGLGGPDYLGR